MKIAILIVGEYRTFPYCRKSMTFLDNPEYDIYFSTWDKTTTGNATQYWHRNKENNNLIPKIDVTVDMVRGDLGVPATIKIQSLDDLEFDLPIMIQGWFKGFQLILDSGIQYDYVFLIRPDLFYDSDFKLDETLIDSKSNDWIGFNAIPDPYLDNPGLDDCSFFTTYENFKKVFSDNLKNKVKLRTTDWHVFWRDYITKDCGLHLVTLPVTGRSISAVIARFGITKNSTFDDALDEWIYWVQSQRPIHVILTGSVNDLRNTVHTMRFLEQENLNTYLYLVTIDDISKDEVERIIGRSCTVWTELKQIKQLTPTDLVLTVPMDTYFTFDNTLDTKNLIRINDNIVGCDKINEKAVTLNTLTSNTFTMYSPIPFNGNTKMLLKNLLIIFDLDGVLIDSKDMHYQTLNAALAKVDEKYVIDPIDHQIHFDGLPTIKKLERLTLTKNLPVEHYQQIRKDKQEATVKFLSTIPKNEKLIELFVYLKQHDNKIAVASNSVRETVNIALNSLGLKEHVDLVLSNEDVKSPKPHPEMFWKCMSELSKIPNETVILEDSHIGLTAARQSGAYFIPVVTTEQVSKHFIENSLRNLMRVRTYGRWKDDKMNVLVPMAGLGKRFSDMGYDVPKPLIMVNDKPMIEQVVNSLNVDANYIFIVQKEHIEKYNVDMQLRRIKPDCQIIEVDGITEGAACTTLLAKHLIDNENPLLIANSDQLIEWDSFGTMYTFKMQDLDGGILTFYASDDKWSYAETDHTGLVKRVAEKEQISNQATVGVYYWKHGSDYVKYTEQMIRKNIRTNNEFYVCPVFNELIADNKKVRAIVVDKMFGIGTPEDLTLYLNNLKLGLI